MYRNQRRGSRNNGESKTSMLIMIGVIIVAVISFILAYVLYGNRLANQTKISNVERRAEYQNSSTLNNITNTEASEVSTSIGKSINEVESGNEVNTVAENTEKRAVNTSSIEKNVVEERNNTANNTTSEENNSEEQETTENVTFVNPVEGEIIKNYASDSLLYSNTLDEWTTHLGIDYAAEKTSVVKASASGTVKSIKNDPRYGLTVVIEHSNGFTSMYANLLSTEFIQVGEKVEQGQTIATVGNTATFEIADETHLHFEILKDGVNVDPNLYLK